MGSSYRRLEVQLPQFWLEEHADAEDTLASALRKQRDEGKALDEYNEKDRAVATILQALREKGPVGPSATVPGLAGFLESYWEDIQRAPANAAEVDQLRRELEDLDLGELRLRAEQEGLESVDGGFESGEDSEKGSLINRIVRLHDGLSRSEVNAFVEGLHAAEPGAATASTRGDTTKRAPSAAPAPSFDVDDNLWDSVKLRAKYRKILGKFAEGAPTAEVAALFIEQLDLKHLYIAKKLNPGEITIGFDAPASTAGPEPEPEPELEPELGSSSTAEESPTTSDQPHPVAFKDGFREAHHGSQTVACTEFQVACMKRPTSKFERRIIIEVAHELGLDHGVTGSGSGIDKGWSTGGKAAGRHVVVGRYNELPKTATDGVYVNRRRALVLSEAGVGCEDDLDLPQEVRPALSLGEAEWRVLAHGTSLRVLEGPYQDEARPRGRLRTKHGWSYITDVDMAPMLEIQTQPRPPAAVEPLLPTADPRSVHLEETRLSYQHFRGWVIPDEKNRLRLAVREAVGKRVVEHVKREMVSVVKTWVDKDSYGALQVQERAKVVAAMTIEDFDAALSARSFVSVPGGQKIDTEEEVAAAAKKDQFEAVLATVEHIYAVGARNDPGNELVQVRLDVLRQKKKVGFALSLESVLDEKIIDRLCPVLISTRVGQTASSQEVRTCKQLEQVIAAKLLEHESMWAVNSATGATSSEGMASTMSDLSSKGSAVAEGPAADQTNQTALDETGDLVRTQSHSAAQEASEQVLFQVQSLGTREEKTTLKNASNFAKMAEERKDEISAEVTRLRSEAKVRERNARRLAADFDTKLAQVLSVLSNKDMTRTHMKDDARPDRGKEQVVRLEAVGVTILWVNCTIGRVDELLRDLERECVEGNGLGWLGSRYGVVTVLDVCVAKPTPQPFEDKNAQASCATTLCGVDVKFYPTDRLPIEEIYHNIKGGADLTSDFMWGLVCAGVIAAVGLFTNSSVMLVASMLISPMMGPILAITFGMAISTHVVHEITRSEMRALDFKDWKELTPVYNTPLTSGDIVLLPAEPCFKKGSHAGEMKKRLGQLVALKGVAMGDEIVIPDKRMREQSQGTESERFEGEGEGIVGQKKVSSEKHVVTWFARVMKERATDAKGNEIYPEWGNEWVDKWVDDDADALPFVEGELEQLMRPLAKGTQVPYLGHVATIRRVVRRPDLTDSERNQALMSKAEHDTLYEVQWDPSEVLDLKKYSDSLDQPYGQPYQPGQPYKHGCTPRRLEVVSQKGQQSKDIHKAQKELIKTGTFSEVVAALTAWSMGFIIAPLFMLLTRTESQRMHGSFMGWPPMTDEMVGRGDYYNFVVGIVFALASGIVVGNGASSGGTNALVGVAISASLLPPVVNSGMCVSYALVGQLWQPADEWEWDAAYQGEDEGLFATLDGLGNVTIQRQLLVAGGISFSLYLMNVLIILFVCWMVFKIKRVEFRDNDLMRDTKGRDQTFKPLPAVTVGKTELTSPYKAAEEALNTEDSAEVEKIGRTLKREETVADFTDLLFGSDDGSSFETDLLRPMLRREELVGKEEEEEKRDSSSDCVIS